MFAFSPPLSRITRAKIGICWFFLNLGMLVGNYVSRLPTIKLEHQLSDGELGLVLLVCAFGTMVSIGYSYHPSNNLENNCL